MPVAEDASKGFHDAHIRLSWTTLAGMILLTAPMLTPSPYWKLTVFAAFVLAVPYALVLWRCLRSRERSGPALAMGISMIIGGVTLLLAFIPNQETWKIALWIALTASHIAMFVFAVMAFRSGTSEKPVWRLLLRGFVDPVVYYGIVFLLFMGALVPLSHGLR